MPPHPRFARPPRAPHRLRRRNIIRWRRNARPTRHPPPAQPAHADAYDLPSSPKRFADGGEYRIEIPSCEGPNAMRAVIAEAAARSVPIHRVSQGSGIMLQTDDEIRDMLALGPRARHRGLPVRRPAGELGRRGPGGELFGPRPRIGPSRRRSARLRDRRRVTRRQPRASVDPRRGPRAS